MKKTWIIIGFCLVLVLGCGCSSSKEEVLLVDSSSSNKEWISRTEKATTPVSSVSLEETCQTYAKQYHTTQEICDLFVKEKVWLVGEETLVQVLWLNGTNQVTAVPLQAIQRVEQTATPTFTTVTVLDKSGKSISLVVSPSQVESLLDFLP